MLDVCMLLGFDAIEPTCEEGISDGHEKHGQSDANLVTTGQVATVTITA